MYTVGMIIVNRSQNYVVEMKQPDVVPDPFKQISLWCYMQEI